MAIYCRVVQVSVLLLNNKIIKWAFSTDIESSKYEMLNEDNFVERHYPQFISNAQEVFEFKKETLPIITDGRTTAEKWFSQWQFHNRTII